MRRRSGKAHGFDWRWMLLASFCLLPLLAGRGITGVRLNRNNAKLLSALQRPGEAQLQAVAEDFAALKHGALDDERVARQLAFLCVQGQSVACDAALLPEREGSAFAGPLLSFWLGKAYALRGDMPAALALWQRAGAASYFFHQARIDVEQGDVEQAVANLDVVVKLEPLASDAFYLKGWILERQGRWRESNANYAQAIANGTFLWADMAESARLAQAYIGFGFTEYQATHDLTRATAALERASILNPQDPWAFIRLCDVYRLAGDAPRALEACDEAVRLMPDQLWALFSRARAWVLAEQYEPAITDLKSVLELDPTYMPARELLAEIMKRRSSE